MTDGRSRGATLASERIAMGGGSSIGDSAERLLELASACGLDQDDNLQDRLGALISEGLAGSVLEMRSALPRIEGGDSGAESSVRKLVGVRHRQAVAEAGLDLLGVSGATDSAELREFLQTRCLTIAGGATQVLLSVAAERILGLPRD